MPSEAEIITLLKRTRANEPDKYKEYVNYYKNKYPDFYERIVKEIKGPEANKAEKPKTKVKTIIQPVNPAEALQEEIKPIGSANVGEELLKDANDKDNKIDKKKKVKPVESTIQKEPSKWRNVIIGIIVAVGIFLIGAIVYFVFFKP